MRPWWTTTLLQRYDRDPLQFTHFGQGIDLREVNETLFAASVPRKKEADTGVLPAHVENGGDKSGTRWLPDTRNYGATRAKYLPIIG